MISMKKVKIKIDYSLLFVALVAGFSGFLKEIVLIYSIIIFHELGHIFFIKLFGGKIEKISLTLIGGIVKTRLKEDTSKWQKLLINLGRTD